jgi:hypothetical protein
MEADCLCMPAFATIYLSAPRADIDTAERARSISLEMENARGQAFSAMALALGRLEVGEWDAALAVALYGVSVARTPGVWPDCSCKT